MKKKPANKKCIKLIKIPEIDLKRNEAILYFSDNKTNLLYHLLLIMFGLYIGVI